MQLDLLYKGLPSAKADTRKFRVQIHSDAISFTQREGAAGGRVGYPRPPARRPRPSSPPSVTFPPGAGEDGERGKKKERKRLWPGWSVPGAARGVPALAPSGDTAGGSPNPGSGPALLSPALPGQTATERGAGRACKQSKTPLVYRRFSCRSPFASAAPSSAPGPIPPSAGS